MIVATGFLRMSAEDLASIRPQLIEAVKAARKQPGCISYAYSLDLDDAGTMWASEVWESMDAIHGHMAKPHFAKLVEVLGSVTVLEQVVNLYPAEEAIPFGG